MSPSIELNDATPLMRRQRISVQDAGEIVTLRVGNADLDMHYETALQVSQWLRMHAKAAKRRAGDMSRHWSAVAMVEK